MKLSILTPACWERIDKSSALRAKLGQQIDAQPKGSVEHLVLLDNRTRSVGLKRQALVDAAIGDYIAFVDDDDDVSDDYVAKLLAGIEHGTDVVTFEQLATVNNDSGHVILKLGQGDAKWNPGGITLRDAWHVNAWKRSIAIQCLFPDIMDGEDRVWSRQARQLARTAYHIKDVLHYYNHNAAHTFATGKTSPEN